MTIEDEVMQLASRVPRAPEVRKLPAGASDAAIDGFVRRTGLSLPDELRTWLRFTNGPVIGPGGIFGVRTARSSDDIEHVAARTPFLKLRWIPIAGDGCGNYYVMALDSCDAPLRPIYFTDHESDGGHSVPAYAVASGLWQFLRFLFRHELRHRGWPFDRDLVLSSDPDLANVRSAPLPWAVV